MEGREGGRGKWRLVLFQGGGPLRGGEGTKALFQSGGLQSSAVGCCGRGGRLLGEFTEKRGKRELGQVSLRWSKCAPGAGPGTEPGGRAEPLPLGKQETCLPPRRGSGLQVGVLGWGFGRREHPEMGEVQPWEVLPLEGLGPRLHSVQLSPEGGMGEGRPAQAGAAGRMLGDGWGR